MRMNDIRDSVAQCKIASGQESDNSTARLGGSLALRSASRRVSHAVECRHREALWICVRLTLSEIRRLPPWDLDLASRSPITAVMWHGAGGLRQDRKSVV